MNSFWHDLPRPFFILAPMEAVTDVVFRHVVARAAPPDIYFTEFTNATGWAAAGDKAIGERLVRTDDEQPIVAQLWGAVPEAMTKLSIHCRELGYNGIDINMGCPDSSATKSGGGAAMCQNPELAAAMIVAAKESGLPISVKTRLGYSRVDEWRDWLTHLLQQDIVNLTIHLRTKKEMSKVPAHFELIDDIVTLRDEIAPQTLLTINGDIRDRAHGLELVRQHPGVDGVMIGRGIFHNPFAFMEGRGWRVEDEKSDSVQSSQEALSSPEHLQPAADKASARGRSGDERGELATSSKHILLDLLHYHLDLHDKWDTPEYPRKFDPLKRFFKVYVREFDGAAELRDKLMHTKSTDEVRAILGE